MAATRGIFVAPDDFFTRQHTIVETVVRRESDTGDSLQDPWKAMHSHSSTGLVQGVRHRRRVLCAGIKNNSSICRDVMCMSIT